MPNDDYILRSDALKAILGVSIYDTIEELEGARTIAENTWADGLYDAYKIIEEEVDAADVEPKRSTGWWIPGDYVAVEHGECVTYPEEGITCSCCHYGFKGRFLWSRDYCPHCGSRMLPEPPKEETVNEITPEMIEAAERNEKRIKERVDKLYDELIAEKRVEIERLEAEIAKMPPLDLEKLAANPPVPTKEGLNEAE